MKGDGTAVAVGNTNNDVAQYVAMAGTTDSSGNPAGNVVVGKGDTVDLLTASTGETGTGVLTGGLYATFQATNSADGTTTTVNIDVSNDDTNWVTMGTISLSGANDTDGFASNAAWKYVRAVSTVTTGTVTVTMGG